MSYENLFMLQWRFPARLISSSLACRIDQKDKACYRFSVIENVLEDV